MVVRRSSRYSRTSSRVISRYKLISAVVRHGQELQMPNPDVHGKDHCPRKSSPAQTRDRISCPSCEFFLQAAPWSRSSFLVDEPVTETTVIIPLVFQTSHRQAPASQCQAFAPALQFSGFFFVEIKIGCFPVVDQNRSFGMLVCATADMLADDLMILL